MSQLSTSSDDIIIEEIKPTANRIHRRLPHVLKRTKKDNNNWRKDLYARRRTLEDDPDYKNYKATSKKFSNTKKRQIKSEIDSEYRRTDESSKEQDNLEDATKLPAPKTTKMDNFDKSFFLYKSDEHEVFHLHDYDHTSDLLILACNHDKTKKILIPTNKASLCKFIPYFSSMANAQNTVFKDFNDAIEKKTPYEMIFTFLRDPRLFGAYTARGPPPLPLLFDD